MTETLYSLDRHPDAPDAPPVLAVIVPVFNVEPYLAECLASIRAQTLENWRCYVVNDGATDGSGAIAREFAAADGRFLVTETPNRGPGAARNLALGQIAAQPEGTFQYIGFVDGDDRLEPEMFDVMIRAAQCHGTTVTCGFYRFDDRGRRDEVRPAIPRLVTQDEFISLIYSEGTSKLAGLSGGMVWKTLFPAASLRSVRFAEDRCLLEDELFMLNVAVQFAHHYVIPSPLYGYRYRQGSLVCQRDINRRQFWARLKGLHTDGLSDQGYGTVLGACVLSAYALLKAGDTAPFTALGPYIAGYEQRQAGGRLPDYALRIVRRLKEHPVLTRLACVLSRFNARLHGRR